MHHGAQHAHPLHIGVLPLHIGSPHEYLALHVHEGAHRGGGHAVLSGARLSDDALLAHFSCQENLPDGVVYLVCPRMVQVLALQVEPAVVALTHALGQVER